MGNPKLLTINGGSSSIKFAIYVLATEPENILSGKITNIGSGNSEFSITENGEKKKENLPKTAVDFNGTGVFLVEWLKKHPDFKDVKCVGHRMVHGMEISSPTIIDDALLAKLNEINQLDPDHLPAEIEMAKLFKNEFPNLLQVASFDTAFHTTLPHIAKLLPIPKRFSDAGIQRYGFHGLSYTYLMETLQRKLGSDAANGRVILAHLGSGSSLAAVKNGKSIDTSMGFTPTGGVPMGTRSGDIDPSVAWFIMQKENMSLQQFNHFINHDCGLIGVSGTTGNMQELLKQESADTLAADAVHMFCYQVKKWIGAFTAVLGGLDILVFAGGIGENTPVVRSRICDGLRYVGIELDEGKNSENVYQISTEQSKVKVLIIPTNEEIVLAKNTAHIFMQRETK